MVWLLIGLMVLILGTLATRRLGQASPARLASMAKWGVVGVAALAGLFFLSRRAIGPAAMCLTFAGGLAVWPGQFWSSGGARGQPAGGGKSDIETAWLRMVLDHETGDVSGTVLAGEFAGQLLADLDARQLAALLRDLRIHDVEGAQLLESYLRRVYPDLDMDTDPESERGGGMTRARALDILGLQDDATTQDIRAAHRRLIRDVHPDQGGSAYLAAQINEARDVLLRTM